MVCTIMWLLFGICSPFLLDSSIELYLTKNPGVYLVTYKMCVHACVWDLNRQPLSLFKQRTSITATWSTAFSLCFQGSNLCMQLREFQYCSLTGISIFVNSLQIAQKAHLPKLHILVAKRFWSRKFLWFGWFPSFKAQWDNMKHTSIRIVHKLISISL